MKYILVKAEPWKKIDESLLREFNVAKDDIVLFFKDNIDFTKDNKFGYSVFRLKNEKLTGPMEIILSYNVDDGIPNKSIKNIDYFFDKKFEEKPQLTIQSNNAESDEEDSASTPLLSKSITFQYQLSKNERKYDDEPAPTDTNKYMKLKSE